MRRKTPVPTLAYNTRIQAPEPERLTGSTRTEWAEISIAARLFPLFVFLMLSDGLLRKSIPTQFDVAILIKDGLLAFQSFLLVFQLLLSAAFRYRLGRLAAFPGLRLATIALVILAIFSSFSLWDGRVTIPIYLLGFREYFFYVLLVVLAFEYFRDIQRRERLLHFLFIAAVLIDTVGLMQAVGIIDSSLLTPIPAHIVSHSSVFGEYTYASSVFDVPERFAVFNLFVLFAAVSLLTHGSKKSRTSLLTLAVLLAWLSLFVSARRIAFLLGNLALPVLIIGQRRRAVTAVLIVVSIFISHSVLRILNPTLFQVFVAETVDDIFFYVHWITNDIERAIRFAPALLYGNLGLTSPGIGFVGIGRSPIYGILEGIWAKTIYALGLGGALILFIAQAAVVLETFRAYLDTRDKIIGAVLLYLICMSAWNIKSGEYLVWGPMTMIGIGLSYAVRVTSFRKSQ